MSNSATSTHHRPNSYPGQIANPAQVLPGQYPSYSSENVSELTAPAHHRDPQTYHAPIPGPSTDGQRPRIPSSVEAARQRPASDHDIRYSPTTPSHRHSLAPIHQAQISAQQPLSGPGLHYMYDRNSHPTHSPVSATSQNVITLPQPLPRPLQSNSPLISPTNYQSHRRQSSSRDQPSNRRQSGSSASTPLNVVTPPMLSQPEPIRLSQQSQQPQGSVSTDSVFVLSTDAALAPVRSSIEKMWEVMVVSMRQPMLKMHNDYTALALQERHKNALLINSLSQIEAKLQAAMAENRALGSENAEMAAKLRDATGIWEERERMKKQNESLKRENAALQGENNGLRRHNAEVKENAHRYISGYKDQIARLRGEKEKLGIERGDMSNPAQENTSSVRVEEKDENISSMIQNAVNEQVARQVESRLSTLLDEMQEQKGLRMHVELKSTETLRHLEEAKLRHSEPSPFPRAAPNGRRESVSSPDPARASVPRLMDNSRPSSSSRPSSHTRRDSSPHILSDIPALSRLSFSSHSSTPTPVEPSSSSPAQLKGPRDIPESPIMRSPLTRYPTSFQSSPHHMPASRPSETYSPSLPEPTHHPLKEAQSTTRKRVRAEYEQEDPGIDRGRRASPKPATRSPSSPPPRFRVKTEDQAERHSSVAMPRADPPEPVPVHSVISPEEGEIDQEQHKAKKCKTQSEFEDGEVVDHPGKSESEAAPAHAHSRPALSPTQGASAKPRGFKLGINHMDLLYKTESTGLVCRMCLTRRQEAAAAINRGQSTGTATVEKFPKDASWDDLVRHCQMEHPKACQDLEKLNPSQVAERKQRMLVGSTRLTR